jgi:DNA polymerase
MAYAIDNGPVQLWVPSQFDLPADYEETRTKELHHKIGLAEKRVEKYTKEDRPDLKEKAESEIKFFKSQLNEDGEFKLSFTYHTKVPAFIKDEKVFKELGGILEAHNAAFEQAIWNNILVPRYGAFKTEPIVWRDSMAMCAAHSIPLSLDKAGKALGVKHLKDEEGKRVMLQVSQPRRPSASNPKEWWEPTEAPDKFETLFMYCMDDVECERAIGQSLKPLIKKEQWVWLLDQIINQRGVEIDVNLVHRCLDLIKDHSEWGKREIKRLTNGEVSSVSLVAQLKDWVNKQGVGAPDMTKATVESLIANESTPEKVKEALIIRQSLSKSSTKKLETMLNARASDNRIRNVLLYHGASTGRWAGRLIQVQNFPRGSIKDVDAAIKDIYEMDVEELHDKYRDVMELISSCLRGMIVPAKGHDFIVADYGAIEARVVMWLADEKDALQKFRDGVDLYKDMAAYVYEKDIDEVDSGEERQLGKAIILGCGFGMGAIKFQGTTESQGLFLPEGMAKTAVKAYRTKYPNIPLMWKNVEKAAIDAVMHRTPQTTNKVTWTHNLETNFLECLLPSGRSLYYYDPKIRIRWAVKWVDADKKFHFDKYESKEEAEMALDGRRDDVNCQRLVTDEPEEVYSLTHMGVNSVTKQWERQETYGGKLVENIVQATARDCMVEGMFRTERKKYLTIMTIHDEIVAEVPEGYGSVEEFESLLAQTPDWADGLPLIADGGYRGKRYRK